MWKVYCGKRYIGITVKGELKRAEKFWQERGEQLGVRYCLHEAEEV